MARKSVAYVYPFSYHYRAPFNEALRVRLAAQGIDYSFIFCADPKVNGPRGDLVEIPWATDTRCSKWTVGSFELRYQHAFREALRHDLIIVQQENGLLLNYPLLAAARLLGKRVAFFGHGRNFQSDHPNGASERFKRFWLNKVDWWFAYTDLTAEVIKATGFPPHRITVFNNAIDTTDIRRELAAVERDELDLLRTSLVDGSKNVGVFVGGLYPQKRIPFLLQAADHIRQSIPDFHLLIIGAGIDAHLATEAARERAWVHYLGPKFGAEKARLLRLAKVLLMPGLVGLAVLDSFACELPMVTTDVPYHSPEIAYLSNGRNGLVIDTSSGVAGYADAVKSLLLNEEERRRLINGMRDGVEKYSIEQMSSKFFGGVIRALDIEPN